MPIDLPTLQSIRRMLRAGVRHAEIARRLDLAVGTISRIASVRRLRRLKLHLLSEEELPEDDPPPDYLAANLRRCPGCGGLVYQWPCLACRLRAAEEAGISLADGEQVEPCALLGFTDASSAEMELNRTTYPGLRPGLSQVGPLGRSRSEPQCST